MKLCLQGARPWSRWCTSRTFGFLGSKGSGKTTTLRALLGIYQPTAGTLHIDGKPFEPSDGARLGYLPEERGYLRSRRQATPGRRSTDHHQLT